MIGTAGKISIAKRDDQKTASSRIFLIKKKVKNKNEDYST